MLSKQNTEFLAQAILVAMTIIGVLAIVAPFWMFDQSEAILGSENPVETKDNYEKSLTALATAGGSLAIASLLVGFLAMKDGSIKMVLDSKNYTIYLFICAIAGIAIMVSASAVNNNIDETAEAEQIGDDFKPSLLMNIVIGAGAVCLAVAVIFLLVISKYSEYDIASPRLNGTSAAFDGEGEFGFDFEF